MKKIPTSNQVYILNPVNEKKKKTKKAKKVYTNQTDFSTLRV